MNNQNEIRELIDRYLQGEMSDKEKVTFEQRLIDEPDLREEFENQKKIIDIVSAGALKEKLEELHLRHQIKKRNHGRFYLYTATAVAATFAIVLSFWFMYQPAAGTPYEQMIASVYFKDPGLPTLMSTAETNREFELAMIDYKLGDYRSSLDRLTALSEENPQNDTIRFYLGVNWFELGNFQRAGQLFEELRTSDSRYVIEKAEWYSALNYLHLEDREKAGELFNNIAEDYSHLYQSDASNAMLMMERFFDENY